MLYYRHNESQIRGTGRREEGGEEEVEDHGGGGRRGENDSKHICPQFVCSYNTKPQAWPCTNLSPLGKAARGNVSRPWVFNARTRGNSLSPRSDSSVRQGQTNIDGGGTHKQVAQTCEWLWTASGAVVCSLYASQGNNP